MLGLGDVVVPGLFLALLLRFDVQQKRRGKPFFRSTLLAYSLGLALTLYVMFTFDAAQPALLYLVPACLGMAAFVGLWRGEFSQFASYSEEEEEPLSPTVRRRRGSSVRSRRRSSPRAPSRRSGPRRRGARHAPRRSRQGGCEG